MAGAMLTLAGTGVVEALLGGGLAQPRGKTGQLQVQPLADITMQAVQALFEQHPESLPGLLRVVRCDRPSAHLERQGFVEIEAHRAG